MITWDTIKELSTGKLTTSSAIWIFIVPAIAKISEGLEGKSDLFSFQIVAPYSLILLYFSALAFFLASVIYIVRCPSFVKSVSSYNDFTKQGMSHFNLTESVKLVDDITASNLKLELKDMIATATTKEIDKHEVISVSAGKKKETFTFNKHELPEVFWLIYLFHIEQRKFEQWFAMSLYIAGFCMLGYTLIVNLCIVVEYIMP